MGVTGSSAEIFCSSVTPLGRPEQPDYDQPVTNADLAEALRARVRPLEDDEVVEVDVRGDDAIGI